MTYLLLITQILTLVLVAWLLVSKGKVGGATLISKEKPSTETPSDQDRGKLDPVEEVDSDASIGPNRIQPSTPTDWIEAAEQEASEGARLDMMEDGFRRFRSSRKLFSGLVKKLIPLTREGEELSIRRKALSDLNDYTQVFRSNCSLEDYSYGKEVSAEVRHLREELATDIAKQRRSETKAQLESLEEQVKHLVTSDGSAGDEEIEEVARVDEALDKDVINNTGELQKRYDDVSEQLISFFRKRDESATEIDRKAYSKRALKAAEEAWKLFKENESKWRVFNEEKIDFNEEEHLQKLVEHLGGWQPQFITPATSTYVQCVYGEIFQTLEPKGQARMTEMMIEANEKQPHE